MKILQESVAQILDREIARLNKLSITDGLGLNDVKKLDLLIRAIASFATPPVDETTAPATPADASTDDLLNGLHGSEQNPV